LCVRYFAGSPFGVGGSFLAGMLVVSAADFCLCGGDVWWRWRGVVVVVIWLRWWWRLCVGVCRVVLKWFGWMVVDFFWIRIWCRNSLRTGAI